MHLVDSSSWIHGLRPGGDAQVRARVERLVLAGDACWCSMVRLELWNGPCKEHERHVLREMEARLIELELTAGVWEFALELARKDRRKGLAVPATDLLVAACARYHQVGLEHCDHHLTALEKIV
jgi:predicted nucleic acid-binding protein